MLPVTNLCKQVSLFHLPAALQMLGKYCGAPNFRLGSSSLRFSNIQSSWVMFGVIVGTPPALYSFFLCVPLSSFFLTFLLRGSLSCKYLLETGFEDQKIIKIIANMSSLIPITVVFLLFWALWDLKVPPGPSGPFSSSTCIHLADYIRCI